jgi:predicted DsbA family dithiol-disulfide isomerase
MQSASEILPGQLSIKYFTDPLCCWSWTFEPVFQQLKDEMGEALSIQYYMCGLLSSWENYNDTLNAVSKPIQMGPIWLQAKQMSGTYINDRIWFTDPPASSYPACTAVKCAAMQSRQAEELYLLKLREAVMVYGKNIARRNVLIEIATALSDEFPGLLDISLFVQELTSDNVINAFRKDMQEADYRGITRLPTLLISTPGKKGHLMLVGNRPYSALRASVQAVLDKQSV